MKGITIAEECHVVNALPPVDIDGGKNSDVWSMANHSHATIIIQMGVTGAASTVTVEACDDFVPTNQTAIAFARYDETTAGGDTLGARTSTTSAGFATSTNDNIFYVIEIDAAELPEDRPNLRVCFSTPGVATLASVCAILSGSRYAQEQSATAIA